MDEEDNKQLQEQYEQMVQLRNDSSLISGFTFHTVAGDINIKSKHRAIMLLDCFIRDLKDEIIHKLPMKRVVRLIDKTTDEIFSYPTIAELVRRNGEDRLGISLNALYNAVSKNDGRWENREYKVFYEDINLGKSEWA